MSEKRITRDEGTTTTRTNEVIDAVRDNTLRVADEVAKIQPQFAQSISNLQLDYIQTVRSMIQTGFANQKQAMSTLNIPQGSQVSEQVAKILDTLSFSQLAINKPLTLALVYIFHGAVVINIKDLTCSHSHSEVKPAHIQ